MSRAAKKAKQHDGTPVATRNASVVSGADVVPQPNGDAVQPTARSAAISGNAGGADTAAAASSDANGGNGVVRTAAAEGAVPSAASASGAVGGKRKAMVMAKHRCRGMCMEEGYACVECWEASQQTEPLDGDDTADGHNNGSADDKDQFYETDSGTDDGDEGEAPPVRQTAFHLLSGGQWHAMKLADMRSYMRAAALRFARGEDDPQREGTSQITTGVTAN